jgi:hypothetical protein
VNGVALGQPAPRARPGRSTAALLDALRALGNARLAPDSRLAPRTRRLDPVAFYQNVLRAVLRRIAMQCSGRLPCRPHGASGRPLLSQAVARVLIACDEWLADTRPAHPPTFRPAPDDLGTLYQEMLSFRPLLRTTAGRIEFDLVPDRDRRSSGAYYTAPELVDLLLDSALEPLIAERLAAVSAGETTDAAAAERALLDIHVCDPACGCGNFLLTATRRIAVALARVRAAPATPSWQDKRSAMRDVLRHCIYGIDKDPLAAEICRTALCIAAGTFAVAPVLERHVRCADALDDAPAGGHSTQADPAWRDSAEFDVVIGNPPFMNAIEGRVDEATKARLRRLHPMLGGTADLAYHFLVRGTEMVRRGGRVAFVLPRAVLSARPVARFRNTLGPALRPNLIYAPSRADFFADADVFICGLVLGPEPLCRVSCSPDPRRPRWSRGVIEGENWWAALQGVLAPDNAVTLRGHARLGECYDVAASMTAGDAYVIRNHLVDDDTHAALKLVTTGLIEPGECRWGHAVCRYLGRDYRWPRVPDRPSYGPALRRRLANARRPKVIVAGLSKRIECFVDRAGECIGAVSTYSIFDRADNIATLEHVASALLAPAATERFLAELGASALGGGNITMTKWFLQQFSLGAVPQSRRL